MCLITSLSLLLLPAHFILNTMVAGFNQIKFDFFLVSSRGNKLNKLNINVVIAQEELSPALTINEDLQYHKLENKFGRLLSSLDYLFGI